MRTTNLCAAFMAILTMIVSGSLLAGDEQVRIIPAEGLPTWWQADPASPNPPPPYYDRAVSLAVEGCMAVAFLIHADGSVSNERIWRNTLRSFPGRSDMEKSVLQTVHQWRFIPSPENKARAPVYSYQTITFSMSGDPWKDRSVRSRCKVRDFTQEVQDMINTKRNTTGSNP